MRITFHYSPSRVDQVLEVLFTQVGAPVYGDRIEEDGRYSVLTDGDKDKINSLIAERGIEADVCDDVPGKAGDAEVLA